MPSRKILLVDDADTVLLIERMILSQCDYELLSAKCGEEAIEVAVAERPDLILLDVIMPGMNGFEVCERLRQHPETKKIPIIMVTTRGEAMNVETGYEAGCNDYVTKPIDGALLLAKVRDLLAPAS